MVVHSTGHSEKHGDQKSLWNTTGIRLSTHWKELLELYLDDWKVIHSTVHHEQHGDRKSHEIDGIPLIFQH
ncbi:hypothetical protein MRB53_031832 [Persea americana]|uniref:Uncharacterized protein n=1 Tax=Persea americana TaxID=3435 RepID=A0ACC2KQ65_PERAE|nr:hypothetical protein MRB53_031832 [Persea americana]